MRCVLFTVEERGRVRERILAKAEADARIVAGAEIGSLAGSGGDRWSDLDLTFGVGDGASIADLLDEWTSDLAQELDAVHLFDLHAGAAIYRVFLLPGLLQVDLSFAPAAEFRARGPKFRLLFGEAAEAAFTTPPSAEHLFGLAVHHALRTRFCVERGRLWQAEYWLTELRRHVLELACLRLGLSPSYARSFDDLPAEVVEPLRGALVGSLEREQILRALDVAIGALLRETSDVRDVAERIESELRSLAAAPPPLA
jgi:hypothetical protein